ncbi:MAG: protease modulator HflC [Desulfobacterales bacterium]|nr:protease modulator HflC [Desulfobacterales bacterium]
MKAKIILTGSVLLFLLLFASAYVVDETEQVVITRFDKVMRTATSPGLNFKLPVIEKAVYYPKNLQMYDGDPGQIPTQEKTYIWVDSFARWKIVEPATFFRTIGFIGKAQQRLDEIIDPAVRNSITSNKLIEAVRNSNRELDTFELGLEDIKKDQRPAFSIEKGRAKLTQGILEQAKPKMAQFGIELADVKIKRINYVEQVQNSVFGRMIAERKQIAEKFRSEGKGEARKIIGEKERDLKEITSNAYRKAQEIKGEADAEATKIYAGAYGVDPEYYSFIRTLEIYTEALDDKNSLVLSTDSEFFKYLKGYPKTP